MGVLSRAFQRHQGLLMSSFQTRLLSSFKADDLHITLTNEPAPKPSDNQLKFGHQMTDHILEIDWSKQHGWSAPVIKPFEPLEIHPCAKVLHYSSSLFEGMKAFRGVDNRIRIFRPKENMKRMSLTAERTELPAFDQDEFLKCIKKLISIDQDWVPSSEQCSLYVRPTFIGTEATLGLSSSEQAKLFVVVCPVGPYFPTGMKPIGLLADPQYVRAWPGGCGSFKMSSNYASTITIQTAAAKLGLQQVLWLFGRDQELTEVGSMNLFIYWTNELGERELVTPTLESGLILPGVTRKSVLELAREWNEFKVSEKRITMEMFIEAYKDGRVHEVFGTGTACVVCPINKIMYQGDELHLETSEAGLMKRFYDTLNDIQYYRTPHQWMEGIEDDVIEQVRTFNAQ